MEGKKASFGLSRLWTRRSRAQRAARASNQGSNEAASPELAATRIGRAAPELLGVLLCYNDADVLPDVIDHLLANGHEIIAWDHGSSDATSEVLDHYAGSLLERRLVPREFDFYKLYGAMSQHLIDNYAGRSSWISWPDQDEILEGPRRDRSYQEYVREVLASPYDWVRFQNFNFWVTAEDDPGIASPTQRVRHYGLMGNCAPRVRAWRASVTNLREFNHNPLPGAQYPVLFNLRHYAARTYEQLDRRILFDRAGLRRGNQNWHYDGLREHLDQTRIPAAKLLRDDGVHDLVPSEIFDWQSIYTPSSG